MGEVMNIRATGFYFFPCFSFVYWSTLPEEPSERLLSPTSWRKDADKGSSRAAGARHTAATLTHDSTEEPTSSWCVGGLNPSFRLNLSWLKRTLNTFPQVHSTDFQAQHSCWKNTWMWVLSAVEHAAPVLQSRASANKSASYTSCRLLLWFHCIVSAE